MNLAVAMLSVAFLQTGCSEEGFPQPQQSGAAGTLHIASISIDGQQVKSRAVADDGNQYGFNEYAYNQSLNSFANGDELVVEYRFGDGNAQMAFINYKDGNWSFTKASKSETGSEFTNTGTPITIVPGEGKKWKDIVMAIGSNANFCMVGADDAYADVATELGIVQGDLETHDIRLAADWLYADSRDGSLTVDTDIKSPTLGAVSATLKHGFRSLLRLPKSAISIDTRNPYLVGGQNYSVTDLATLWAVMTKEGGTGTNYFPLTQVDSNLQSIIRLQDSPYLTGFKAVLYTTESGQPGDEGYDATKVLTLDLPLKAGTETLIRLEENYMYPLTLSISPNRAFVTLSGDGLGKPGWGEDEDETTLDNGLNDLAAKAKTELSYTVSTSNFSVSGPNGLMLLNKWMTEGISTEAFRSVAFEGANNITNDDEPLAQNITFTADITLPAPKDGESNWIPIITDSAPYTGTIDGGGKTLTGMVINSTGNNQGFVGYLGEGGKVQNLTFNDAQVTGENYTAIVVGQMNKNTTVENCHTTATSSVKGATMQLGGLVGYSKNGIITRCSNAAQVEGSVDIGGIVGRNLGIVSACINSGAVSADLLIAGGIVGHNKQGLVIACGNIGTINGKYNLGGIVGRHDGGNVIASWTQDTNEINNYDIESSPENGVGQEESGIITACHVFSEASAEHITTMNIAIAAWNATDGNTAVAYGWQATTSGQWPSLALITELSQSWPVKEGSFYKVGTDYYTAAGVKVDPIGTDFYTDGTDYYTSAGVKVEDFELADGTATVSKDNANALLLWNAMAQTDLTLNLTLKADITLPQPAEGGSNWTPVGNISTPYTGTINGGGHTLTGMVINSTKDNQGFVGYLGSAGKVQNLTFANATVISSEWEVGIVAGYNNGTVENCHTTGTSSVESFDDVGGIVGYNSGLVFACINSSAVSATVEKDPWDGSVSKFGGVGGIVGDNYGDVIACGNTGTVDGKYNLGGIVGRHDSGSVIASWTQDTNETDNDGNAPSSPENGVGNEASGCSITDCYVLSEESDVTVSISKMNTAIVTYNSTASVKCLYRWEPATSGYPTLKTVTE